MATVKFKKLKQYIHYLADIYLFFEDNRRVRLDTDNVTEVKFEKGRHTVYAKLNRVYSPVIEFQIDDNDEVLEFEVGYNLSGLKSVFNFWYYLFDKYNYIYIKQWTNLE